jgi:methionine sulfoxide reductase heme-binding subunit
MFPFPWNDRAGRFSPFKALVFAAALTPALWLAWRAGFDLLGPRPWVEATHRSGDWALRLLFLSLAVTPLRRIFGWARLMTVRRMLGLFALGYALLHLGLYVGDQALDWGKIAGEITSRIYLTIGFTVVLGLCVLGVTSTDEMIRRLGGRRWRALHRVVYPLAILATLHFFMQSKLEVAEATLMAGALLWLFAVRLSPRSDAWSLTALALLAALGTAGVEALWIGLKTGAPPTLILAANLDFDLGLRPAWGVLAAGLLIAALCAAVAAVGKRRIAVRAAI